jgi:hypothetical protein
MSSHTASEVVFATGRQSGQITREKWQRPLAPVTGDKVEAAYRRSDLFEKRRRLMNEWGRYYSTPAVGGKILQMRKKA